MEDFEPLSPDKFASLQEVSKSATPGPIPHDHRVYLIAKGYIRLGPGRLTVTDKGRLRVASGH